MAKERQERNNAASLKETEMKQDAEAALAKFHADRKAANAAAEMSNQAEEKAAAAYPEKLLLDSCIRLGESFPANYNCPMRF